MAITKGLRPTLGRLIKDKSVSLCKSTLYGKLRKLKSLLHVDVQWNLVCDRSWLVWMTQSAYMAGRIVGTQIYGFLLDRSDFTHSLWPPECSFLRLHVLSLSAK